MEELINEWPELTTVPKDIFRLLVGNKIGGGCYRDVYELTLNPELVIKIEQNSYRFHNILEYELWKALRRTDQAKWLAPVKAISPCGTCIIMARTQPVPADLLPKFVPAWLTDIKPDNWGWYKDRAVCHDYSINLITQRGVDKKVIRAEWERHL